MLLQSILESATPLCMNYSMKYLQGMKLLQNNFFTGAALKHTCLYIIRRNFRERNFHENKNSSF